MAVNLVVQDGVVKSPALRYSTDGKPELRFTLAQTEKDWPLYLPCVAVGSAAERLASELEDGQHIMVTSAKLVYRKRSAKGVEQSRMEILVLAVDRLTVNRAVCHHRVLPRDRSPDEAALLTEDSGASERKKSRKPRYGWKPEHAN